MANLFTTFDAEKAAGDQREADGGRDGTDETRHIEGREEAPEPEPEPEPPSRLWTSTVDSSFTTGPELQHHDKKVREEQKKKTEGGETTGKERRDIKRRTERRNSATLKRGGEREGERKQGEEGDSGVRPSRQKSCSHLLPVDVESSDKDLDKYVTATKHKYWCSSDAPPPPSLPHPRMLVKPSQPKVQEVLPRCHGDVCHLLKSTCKSSLHCDPDLPEHSSHTPDEDHVMWQNTCRPPWRLMLLRPAFTPRGMEAHQSAVEPPIADIQLSSGALTEK
ncbi:hypothetical protein INR49_006938 [Caranx melampygus]|nr:hypothetical protein INR49_006938 [Caranx melampygus]